MRKLNYAQIEKEALLMGISKYALAKRKINYREDFGENCGACANKVIFYGHFNCRIIGESFDENAKIVPHGICDYMDRRK